MGGGGYDVRFWRARSGAEVDFIVYGSGGFWAIEVKNSERIHPRDLSALRSFRQEYPECEALFLYRGKEQLLRNDVKCIPCGDFLRDLSPGRSLDAGIR